MPGDLFKRVGPVIMHKGHDRGHANVDTGRPEIMSSAVTIIVACYPSYGSHARHTMT